MAYAKFIEYAIIFSIQLLFGLALAAWFILATAPASVPLIGIGLIGTPITVNQKQVLNAGGDVISVVNDSKEFLANLASEVWLCIEPAFVALNIVTEFFFSLIKRVTAAIPGVPDLFVWARLSQMERFLQTKNNMERSSQAVFDEVANARHIVANMSATDAKVYLRRLEQRLISLPNAPNYRNTARNEQMTRDVVTIFRSVIRHVFSFIINVLDIFLPFLLDLLDFIIEFFWDPVGGIQTAFEEIIVRFLIDVILDELGFADCFKNLPDGLIICIAPWRYDQPYSFPPALDFADDAFPNGDPLMGFLGAACPRFDIDISSYTSWQKLLFACFGIDYILDAFYTVRDFVWGTLMTIVNGLEASYNWLYGQVQDAWSAVKDILKEIKKLKKLFRDADLEWIDDAYDNFVEEGAYHSEYVRRLTEPVKKFTENLDTEFVERYHRILDKIENRALRSTAEGVCLNMRMLNSTATILGNQWKKHSTLTFAERVAMRIERSPQLSQFFSKLTTNVDPTTAENMGKIVSVIRNTIAAARDSIFEMSAAHREARSRSENGESGLFTAHGQVDAYANSHLFEEKLNAIDFEGMMTAVHNQARHVRMMRGDDPDLPHSMLRNLDAGLQLAVSSMFSSDSLPHVAQHLAKKYAQNTTVVGQGAAFAARVHRGMHGRHPESLAPMEDIRSALEMAGINERDIAREVEEQRESMRHTFEGHREQLRKQLNEAWKEHNVLSAGSNLVALGVTSMFHVGTISVSSGARFLPALVPVAIAPLLALAPLFINEIINIVVQAGTGTLIAATSSAEDRRDAQAWSPITPYINVWTGTVVDSFNDPLNPGVIGSTLLTTIDITLDQLQYMGNMVVRSQLGKLPLPLGSLSLPPLPVLDSNGQPTQGMLDYITDWFFCDPTRVCGDWDSCGANQPCRCPKDNTQAQDSFYRTVDVPRQRTAVSGNPCRYGDVASGAPRGRCHCHPFVVVGQEWEIGDTTVSSAIDCVDVYGFDIDGIQYWNVGWWTYLVAVVKNTDIGLQIIVRAILYMEPFNDENMFMVILGTLPCACLWPLAALWSQISIAVNSTVGVRNDVLQWFNGLFFHNRGVIVVGPIFEHLYKYTYAPNPDGAGTCLAVNVFPTLVGMGSIVIGTSTISALALTLGWVTALVFLVNVVLFVFVGIPILIICMFYSAIMMASDDMLQGAPTDEGIKAAMDLAHANANGGKIARRAIEIKEDSWDLPSGSSIVVSDEAMGKVKSSTHLHDAGLDVCSGITHIGNRAVFRRKKVGERKYREPVHQVALRTVFRSIPLIFSMRFLNFAWHHNFVRISPLPSFFQASGRPSNLQMHSPHAIYDQFSSTEDEFPLLAFIATENSTFAKPISVIEDPSYAVCDPFWLYGHRTAKRMIFHGDHNKKNDDEISEESDDEDDVTMRRGNLRRRI